MTVVLRESTPPVECTRVNVYIVPMTAHQCMPETAPAMTTAHPILFHHELVHELLKTKNSDRATVLAAAAMTTEPTTKGTR